MRMGSYNIRGLGGRAKKREIQQLVRTQKLEVLSIQETKIEQVDRPLCRLLWDDDDFEWVSQPSPGASGGVILL